jgi:hypothetical protein
MRQPLERGTTWARVTAVTVVLAVIAIVPGCSHDSAKAAQPGATTAPPISTKRGAVVPATALANRVSAAVLKAGSARFALSSTLVGGTVAKGSVVTSASDPRLSIATTGPNPIKAVILPGQYFVDPGKPQNGKHWVKLGSVTGRLTFTLVGPVISRLVQAADVGSLVGGWSGAGTFTVGRTSKVAGVKATPYVGSLPKSAVLSGIRSEISSALGGSVSAAKVTIWLDAAGRPIRTSTVASVDGTPVTTTVTYSGWGHGPAIVAPPPGDVLSFGGL